MGDNYDDFVKEPKAETGLRAQVLQPGVVRSIHINEDVLGSGRFVDLSDTPSAYADQSDKFVKVNSEETGLAFQLVGASDVQPGTFPEGAYIFQGLVTINSINLEEYINFTGATTENLIKIPDNLAVALDITEGSNSYVQFITSDGDEDILFNKTIDIHHTAIRPDDHAVEIDVDAATFGDVKAIDIDYITGILVAGRDEGIILVNIDETLATGGEVFGLEVLATDGNASIHGMKVGPVVHPIHQNSGTFANPSLATNNTPSTDVPVMRDGIFANTTAIFNADDDYIIIGAAAAFQDMELILSTVSSKNIKPTFWYSTAGTGQFTQFTPVDGTDGCTHTGVISWDASDLTGHVADTGTGSFDIKIIRTRNNIGTTPVLGYAKTAATTEYVWDKNGDVSIRGLLISGAYAYRVGGTDVAVADGGTNLSSYAVGDLLYASGTTTLSKLADVAVGQVLISGGIGVAPAWSASPIVTTIKCTVLTDGYVPYHVSNAVGLANSGLFWDGAQLGIGTASPAVKLDVVGKIISAQNKANNVAKQLILLAHQYGITAEPEGFMMIETFSNASVNRIDIGGGNSGHNAATEITFNTTAGVTTRTGTQRMKIASDGGIHMAGMKSGTDQANAGADAGELYFDTNDDNTVKMGV
ncbi:MAG TPA: hypothetical protein ENI27_09635 [bacterium]|nr:hypothetical protein [bacterium]